MLRKIRNLLAGLAISGGLMFTTGTCTTDFSIDDLMGYGDGYYGCDDWDCGSEVDTLGFEVDLPYFDEYGYF